MTAYFLSQPSAHSDGGNTLKQLDYRVSGFTRVFAG
jgi:hypothetical protein